MQWAERGLKAHPDWRGMRALVARHYEHAGLADEALALHWEDFQRQPDPATWDRLKVAADRQWPRYRSRALEHLAAREHQMPDGRHDASQRAQLLVADGDNDAAIQLGEQQALSPSILNLLAELAANSHPRAAAAFLRRAVDATLPRAVARDYPDMTRQIARVLMLTPDSGTRRWIESILTTYRARRKFISLLNDATTAKPR